MRCPCVPPSQCLEACKHRCHSQYRGGRGQWYAGVILMRQRYCLLIQHTFSWCSTAPVLWVDWPVRPPSASCVHAGAIQCERVQGETVAPRMLRTPTGIQDPQMISPARLLSVVAMLNLCWLECAQNPLAFCYRIGWDV